MSPPNCFLILGIIFFLISFTTIHGHTCSEQFLSEAKQRINTTFCKRYKESNGVEIAMNLGDEKSRRLDIMVGAKLDDETGWLAWGLNPGPEARMVGTRALIGIKQMNGELLWDTYNITNYTKLGCQLLPSPIDLKISNFKFSFVGGYHVIRATIELPITYDVERINHVWQVGINIVDGTKEVRMHPKALRNYDSSETISLKTGKGRGNRVHRCRRIREVHGILNIIGWGTLLPIGVIIARNFRGSPLDWSGWRRCHYTCQTVGYVVGSTGFAVGIWLGKNSKYYSFPKHATFGIFIFTFATLQMLFFKFKGSDEGKLRMYRNMYHHVVGYSILVVSCINILKGINIMHLDNKTYWLPAYLGLAASLGFIFLSFEIVSWYKFICNKFGLGILCSSKDKASREDGKVQTTK